MRTITIVGAGQGGLCLAFGLLRDGHRVRLISNRTAADIENGPVTSSQSMYHTANSIEKDLGLNFWDAECPVFDKFRMTVADSHGVIAVSCGGTMDVPGTAIDQRVKHARWLRHFEAKGGSLHIEEATVSSLEGYARESDLVVVATGKGPLSRLFVRNPSRSVYDEPPHGLALTYVKRKIVPGRERDLAVTINPGVGGFSAFPGLTLSGPCEIFTFGGDAGGPMDRWDEMRTPEEHLEYTQYCLDTHFPLDAKRYGRLELTDEKGVARTRYTPEVRNPVATLPSGAKVLGLADAIILCHPMGGQGSNIATVQAKNLWEAIREHGDKPFDEEFMVASFERSWEQVKWNVQLTNTLAAPPNLSMAFLFDAASHDEELGHLFAQGFDNASLLAPWFFDPAAMMRFLLDRGFAPPSMRNPPVRR